MNLADYKQKVKGELSLLFEEKETLNHMHILFDYFLGLNRAQVVLSDYLTISNSEEESIESAIHQLKKGKPIDYILNQSIFFGREFYIDERVLIPRSETEELVQWILENETSSNLELIDIGSGSGCIPISLALEGKFQCIDACDVSEEANEVARINAEEFGLSINFQELDILTQLPRKAYDVVVSNPPYVKQEELAQMDKNVVEYEPLVALTPNGEPLLFYKRMLSIAGQILKPGGRIYWEIHEDLGKEVIALFKPYPFRDIELKRDIYDRDRLVKATYKGT